MAPTNKPGTYADGSEDVPLDLDVTPPKPGRASDNGGRMTTGATAAAWAKCPNCHGVIGLIRGTVHLVWRQHERRIGRVAVPCRRSGTAVCEHPARPRRPAGQPPRTRGDDPADRAGREYLQRDARPAPARRAAGRCGVSEQLNPAAETPTWTPRPGKALALRSCRRSGYGDTTGKLVGYGDFVWPETPGAMAEAPDWDPTPRCGGGLHGLLWGTGSLGYLGAEDLDTFLVVEVDEDDVVQIEGPDGPDKVKFPRATVIHVGTFASCAELISRYAPDWASRRDELGRLSQYTHRLYAVDLSDQSDDYEEGDIEVREEVPLGPFARVISSEVIEPDSDPFDERGTPSPDGAADGDPLHTIVLDIDYPVPVVESSTSDHHHLYIDVALRWSTYAKLLDALAEAGVVQQGYVDVSKARRGTHLRLPWIRKSVTAPAQSDATDGAA